jgi:hypothetical protein
MTSSARASSVGGMEQTSPNLASVFIERRTGMETPMLVAELY